MLHALQPPCLGNSHTHDEQCCPSQCCLLSDTACAQLVHSLDLFVSCGVDPQQAGHRGTPPLVPSLDGQCCLSLIANCPVAPQENALQQLHPFFDGKLPPVASAC
jgi:hypothetical protein